MSLLPHIFSNQNRFWLIYSLLLQLYIQNLSHFNYFLAIINNIFQLFPFFQHHHALNPNFLLKPIHLRALFLISFLLFINKFQNSLLLLHYFPILLHKLLNLNKLMPPLENLDQKLLFLSKDNLNLLKLLLYISSNPLMQFLN